MTRPAVKWEVSLGHILQAAAMLAAVFTAYFTLDARVMVIEARLDGLEPRLERMDNKLDQLLLRQ